MTRIRLSKPGVLNGRIKAPYPYMSEVYEDEKGIASRAKRGIKQADKVKADKEAFKSGKRKDKYVNYIKSKPMGLFSSYGHFAEPYSNQEDIERVRVIYSDPIGGESRSQGQD